MKIIVIGINHAGTSAVRTLLHQNKTHSVTAYDRNTNISFLGCGIALTVSGIVKNIDSLFYASAKELTSLGAQIFMEHNIEKIDTANKKVTVKNLKTGKIFEDHYDKLIYGAGSWPVNIPGLPEKKQNLKNVMICKIYQHAKELISKACDQSIKDVAVIGAGYIGIELAEAFHQKGKNVTLIDFEKRVLPRYYDPEFTTPLEKAIRKSGVKLALGEKVTGLDEQNGAVSAVHTDKGNYPADLVIQSIGFKPNTELLPEAQKTPRGALIVDEFMRTSIKDIYAIGDAVALHHAVLKKPMQVALATNAVKTGITAAGHINGISHLSSPAISGTNAICVFGHKLASTGLSEEAARKAGFNVQGTFIEDHDRPEFMETYEDIKIKLVYEKESLRLLGAAVSSSGQTNHSEAIYALSLAIQKEMSLYEIAYTDVYFLPHFNKPFHFILAAVLESLGLNYYKGK